MFAIWHHSLRPWLDRIPSCNTQRAKTISWLSRHNIPHTSSQKSELLTLVKNCNLKERRKKKHTHMELTQLLNQQGHQAISLPSYNCQLSLESTWIKLSQVKLCVTKRNNSFKTSMSRVWLMMKQAFLMKKWQNCVRHAQKLQEDDHERNPQRQY